jgi:hypothetical protein
VAAQASANAAFGRAVVSLIGSPTQRGRLGQAAARMARERAAPRVVQQKLADAFESACANVVKAGLRPVAGQGRLRRWATTFEHFRPWATVMGGLYLFGYLRPSPPTKRAKLHPQIGQ